MKRDFGVGAAALLVAVAVQGQPVATSPGGAKIPGTVSGAAAQAPGNLAADPARLEAARGLLRDMNFEHTVMTMLEAQRTQLRTMVENRLIMMPHGNATPAETVEFKNRMLDAWWTAVQPKEMLEQLAKVYAGLFTVSELQSMAAFYRTPAGQKYVATTPALQSQCGAVMQAHIQAGFPKLTTMLGDFQKAHPVPAPAAPTSKPAAAPPAVSKLPPVPPPYIQTK